MTILFALNTILANTEILGAFIAGYILLLAVMVISFVNVYSVDKMEFLSNTQKCVDCKHRLFFVLMYSKEKRVVSKKTLILEICGYVVAMGAIAALVCSLWQSVRVAMIVFSVVAAVVFAFGVVTGVVLYKAKRRLEQEK